MNVIEKLNRNDNWLTYIEVVAEKLDQLIEETRRELKRNVSTASLRFTGVIKAIKEKIYYYTNETFDDNELPELLKVINYFLKPFELTVHPIRGKGLFVSRNERNNKSSLVLDIEAEFKRRISERR